MGKVTGFMEYARLAEANLPVTDRVKNYKEFVLHLTDNQAKQQGARCMDCGIPFCTTGCPINNIIPDWNDLVYQQDWKAAIEVLHSTNNFPEFTGRICPAPCEAACTLNINADPVGIKSIEHAIIDKAWENDWVTPQIPIHKTGKKIAIVGSGPAGMAAAQQLARVGHTVVVLEKSDRIGGLLRYGIPDFKMEKSHIDRRMTQMQAEGVEFRVNQHVGENVKSDDLLAEFDAVVLAGGAEHPRDLPVSGRELDGVMYAMDFLTPQNKVVAGDTIGNQVMATSKNVVVIGGGDTGSDCVGTSNRHGALSITQFELMPQPPEKENKEMFWPNWPLKMRTSSSHEEGANRDWSITTKELIGEKGNVVALKGAKVEWVDGKMVEVADSEFTIKADLVLLAMGFVSPIQKLLDVFGVEKDSRGNVKATTEGADSYKTSKAKVFAAGDVRRGQSLVVWAIREGRQAARAVDEFLMGSSTLPR
ncbi:glutamate synthase subunit beta [Methylotenera sp.]|uniref:glutamate synthase subunit beta n=1 Tax=Methylotenera sp. TaxID=2051956 RepID=UPI002724A887|nr:glutamate synthase subunit beta [Methylotenera sp.]MDO9203984.1 glutamate synthase subunit beta [Methylotenera sp.]MDP1522387.1 glutamate synthase subunit beta [Methylotenera sp.]MDP2072538.1 glutamate synthase subunit beta [Methylotenera sp.]MDP2230844.1 glutamate synthase subunit beta [Methylotenera sp.]MDP3006007.1 glutamate synthase subunit beta [Methylotenera sp.]